jgi:hypothetical protein
MNGRNVDIGEDEDLMFPHYEQESSPENSNLALWCITNIS